MLLRCLFLYQQTHALVERDGDLLQQMDIVVNGVRTLCTTHQELIHAKTELAGANAELEKKAAAAADTTALLGDRVSTLYSELKKTLPTEVNTTYLWVSLCVHMLPHTCQHQHMLLRVVAILFTSAARSK
jgi:hypothetical protein